MSSLCDTQIIFPEASDDFNIKKEMNIPSPIPLVTACRKRDIPVLRILVARAAEFLESSEIHILTHTSNFHSFQKFSPRVYLHDQDSIIPSMTLEALRSRIDLPEMPLAAGWYFQQFLKLSIAERFPEWTRYLIWDSDTLPLRPIETFDNEGRMLFTTANEWHEPYFTTLEHLLGVVPTRKVSLISQHIPVDVRILSEMKSAIHDRFPGDRHWAWKVMENLPGTGHNRFSEYETFGHYALARHPERCAVRDLPWTRHGAREAGIRLSAHKIETISKKYAFAAFEANENPFRRLALSVYFLLPDWARKRIRRSV
jgi:hypothetical protein